MNSRYERYRPHLLLYKISARSVPSIDIHYTSQHMVVCYCKTIDVRDVRSIVHAHATLGSTAKAITVSLPPSSSPLHSGVHLSLHMNINCPALIHVTVYELISSMDWLHSSLCWPHCNATVFVSETCTFTSSSFCQPHCLSAGECLAASLGQTVCQLSLSSFRRLQFSL